MTRVKLPLYKNITLSPVHCDQSHCYMCLYGRIFQWRMSTKHTVRSRQPTERTAVIDFPACSLHAVSLDYCSVALAGALLAVVSRGAERDAVVGVVEAWGRETERTRGLKKKTIVSKWTRKQNENTNCQD
jgi:hypothetical protein